MSQPTNEPQSNPNAAGAANTDDIPEGYYEAQAVGETEPHVQYGTSKNGNEQIAIELKLLDLSRDVFTVLNFSDAAAPFALERLRALGWEGGDDMRGITKNKVQVRAKWDHYTDDAGVAKRTMKFEITTGSRFSFSKPMDDQQKRGFFARLNQLANQAPAPKNNQGGAQAGGYPADWDRPGPAAKPPRVDLG